MAVWWHSWLASKLSLRSVNSEGHVKHVPFAFQFSLLSPQAMTITNQPFAAASLLWDAAGTTAQSRDCGWGGLSHCTHADREGGMQGTAMVMLW